MIRSDIVRVNRPPARSANPISVTLVPMFAFLPLVSRRVRFGIAIGAATLAVLSSDIVRSSPVDDPTLGSAVFTGPAHAHPTSILVNPAALGIGGFQKYVYLGGSARIDTYEIDRLRIVDENGTTEAAPTIDDFTVAPGGLAVLHLKTGRSATLGIALSLPMYERFLPEQEDVGFHILGGDHWQWALTLATSVKLNRRLYFGASLSRVSTRLAMSFFRDTALENGTSGVLGQCGDTVCGIENPLARQRWDVDVDSEGILGAQTVSIRAGFVYRLFRDWWFGLSYHSPPGLQAPLTLKGTVQITQAAIDDVTTPVSTGRAEIIYRLPPTIVVGMRGALYKRLHLILNARWQNLSRQKTLDLRVFGRDLPAGTPEWYPRHRGLRDSFLLEGGVEGPLLGWLDGGVRMRIERGATTSESISPMQIDGFNLGVVLGAQARIFRRFILGFSYMGSYYPTTNATDSDYNPLDRLMCIENDFDIDACTSAAEGRAIASAAGTYSHLVHALRLSLRYSWD